MNVEQRQAAVDNCPQRDSIPGRRALQSDLLPLDHCDQNSSKQRRTNIV